MHNSFITALFISINWKMSSYHLIIVIVNKYIAQILIVVPILAKIILDILV